jgi:hypothetical protein
MKSKTEISETKTTALVRRGRGILKRGLKPNQGDKALTEERAEQKKQEKALEERHAR